jgi:hypothetical protein
MTLYKNEFNIPPYTLSGIMNFPETYVHFNKCSKDVSLSFSLTVISNI